MAETTKILIVDDERINVEFFEVMLTRLGYDVITGEDGDEALDLIVNEQPDLVLLDNILPGRTGWEVTRAVKTDDQYGDVADTPIIMFSAMDDVEDKVEGFQLGIEDYITKPFNFSEVLARIQAVLRQHELTKQVSRRESRLRLLESLRNSLQYFTRHVKEPIGNIIAAARDLDQSQSEAVRAFTDRVIEESGGILASIEGLEEEIAELENRDSALRANEVSLEDLEKKFRKHLQLEDKNQRGSPDD